MGQGVRGYEYNESINCRMNLCISKVKTEKTMGEVGLEPTRLSSPHFECGASTNSAIRPWNRTHHYNTLCDFATTFDNFVN